MGTGKKQLFQITEAAHACGLSRSTLMRMEEKGLLTPAYISPDSGSLMRMRDRETFVMSTSIRVSKPLY